MGVSKTMLACKGRAVRGAAAAVVIVLTLAGAVGCGSPRPSRADASSAATAGTAQQTGAPYPADMNHLDDILAIGTGHELPEQAQVVSVDLTTNLSGFSPGTWGYVIAFTATDPAIRNYVTEHTIFNGNDLDTGPTASAKFSGMNAVDLTTINNPWSTSFGDTILLFERPLGRGWLIIIGGGR
ncbi:hypothetical protein [Actinomyces sp. oral taxon 448]|uniref:hypothetical protein n=1 Tax=Actinomyces sp. oral taxon 448 TaxID=712124 RepID=UPI0002EA811F|nr:hypothetical protein [Actinomyces sp. oral taxon 448]